LVPTILEKAFVCTRTEPIARAAFDVQSDKEDRHLGRGLGKSFKLVGREVPFIPETKYSLIKELSSGLYVLYDWRCPIIAVHWESDLLVNIPAEVTNAPTRPPPTPPFACRIYL
jgi:hypothetical protein